MARRLRGVLLLHMLGHRACLSFSRLFWPPLFSDEWYYVFLKQIHITAGQISCSYSHAICELYFLQCLLFPCLYPPVCLWPLAVNVFSEDVYMVWVMQRLMLLGHTVLHVWQGFLFEASSTISKSFPPVLLKSLPRTYCLCRKSEWFLNKYALVIVLDCITFYLLKWIGHYEESF